MCAHNRVRDIDKKQYSAKVDLPEGRGNMSLLTAELLRLSATTREG